MKLKEIIETFLLVALCTVLFVGCSNTPKTVYRSDSVIITREGVKTTVSDLLSDKEYTYTARRTKRTEAPTEAYTTVETETIKIEVIPSGLRVYDKAEGKAIETKYQRGRLP